MDTPTIFRLDSAHDTQLWVSSGGAMPQLLYWGARLDAADEPAALAALVQPPRPNGGLDVDEVVGWLPEPGRGFSGLPGLELRRGERRVWTRLELRRARHRPGDEHAVRPGGRPPLDPAWTFELVDDDAGVAVDLELRVHAASGVFTAASTVRNLAGEPLAVDGLASIVLPLPDAAAEVWSLGGGWSAEFAAVREPLPPRGAWSLESRTGRSSHHAYPGHVLMQRGTDTGHGEAWSAQLAWSGNHRAVVQRQRWGGGSWHIGALLLPGEVVLATGEAWATPAVHLLRRGDGLRPLALAWHRFVRERVLPPRAPERERRVPFNTWEAVYFDHDTARLRELARAAAAVGVERFVLDDGWFAGRHHDRAGLGDWTPCPQRHPDGLAPLAEHCRALGMQFGLWVEPEGISADSDLYRAHPDWVLGLPGREQPLGRHQYVLDLGRPEVRAHLLAALSALLRSAPIDFLKWDMNRDLVHEAGADGRAGAVAHVRGLHALLADLRQAFPAVEIETCASGGARADLGMLAHAGRVWLSDCNDPVERQPMQAAALMFLPPEVIGAHVGPPLSHTTGRAAGVALATLSPWLFHFGIEADLLRATDAERAAIARAVEAYKSARQRWQDVEASAIDSDDPAVTAVLAVRPDRREAWLSLVAGARPRAAVPGLLRIPALEPGWRYRIEAHPLWPAPGRGVKRGGAIDRGEAIAASGEALARLGLRRPVLWPGDGVLLHLVAEAPDGAASAPA